MAKRDTYGSTTGEARDGYEVEDPRFLLRVHMRDLCAHGDDHDAHHQHHPRVGQQRVGRLECYDSVVLHGCFRHFLQIYAQWLVFHGYIKPISLRGVQNHLPVTLHAVQVRDPV